MKIDIAQRIKDYRVFSITVTFIVLYQLSAVLQWTISLSEGNPTTQQVGLATASLTALVALVKFCFSFSMEKNNDNKV